MAQQLHANTSSRTRPRLVYIALPDNYQGEFEFRGVLRPVGEPELPLFDGLATQEQSAGANRTAEQNADDGSWLTVKECALLLMDDLPRPDLAKAKARVSKAASSGKLRTNGLSGAQRRIQRDSLSTWRLAQREKALNDADRECA